jgi:hypothetical protein
MGEGEGGVFKIRRQITGDVAALLDELREDTGRMVHSREVMLRTWKAAYPEDRDRRPGSAHRQGKGRHPGTRAATFLRRGLAEMEQAGIVVRRGEEVVILDPAGLAELAAATEATA